ncbi:MAG: hypothetical protein ACREQP_05720 [Candidatus Binatia bacterium]
MIYLLFGLVDLRGAKSPSPITPAESSVMAAEAPSDLPTAHRLDRAMLWENTPPVPDSFSAGRRLQRLENHRPSPLDLARSHGCRIGLSLADLPPFAS